MGWFQDIQFSGVLRKSIQKLQEPVEKGVELLGERQSHCHYYQFPSLGYSGKTPNRWVVEDMEFPGLLKREHAEIPSINYNKKKWNSLRRWSGSGKTHAEFPWVLVFDL